MYYSQVLSEEFSHLSMFKPKKDQCEKCREESARENGGSNEAFSLHKRNKELAKAESDKDLNNKDPKVMIFRYDLQKTVSLPTSTVSISFYLRKLSLFNLTGFCASNHNTYCSFWDESRMGRSGNDLASAHNNILQSAIDDNPSVEEIVVWSDSCVPQNKNQMVSLSSLSILRQNPQIKKITHKYGEPGHSFVQQIDCVHSAIDRHCKDVEFFSPISWISHMKKMDYPKVKLIMHQMEMQDFKNFSIISNQFEFNKIPFNHVRLLQYTSDNLLNIGYKKAYDDNLTNVLIIKSTNSRLAKKRPRETARFLEIPDIPVTTKKVKLSHEKVKDLKKMIKFMSDEERNYYVNNIF